MLIDEDRVSIRVHSDEAGRPRCALSCRLLQLHPLGSWLALQLTNVGEPLPAPTSMRLLLSRFGSWRSRSPRRYCNNVGV
jgi:hypothetical protein